MNDSSSEQKGINLACLLPGVADFIFFAVFSLLLSIQPSMLLSDGSTGWHIVSGNYILSHHNIPHTDIMSYTFSNKPWTAYEWFSDLSMAISKIGSPDACSTLTSVAPSNPRNIVAI